MTHQSTELSNQFVSPDPTRTVRAFGLGTWVGLFQQMLPPTYKRCYILTKDASYLQEMPPSYKRYYLPTRDATYLQETPPTPSKRNSLLPEMDHTGSKRRTQLEEKHPIASKRRTKLQEKQPKCDSQYSCVFSLVAAMF